MKFTETQLESAIIELLGVEGYPHVLGEAFVRQLVRTPYKFTVDSKLAEFSKIK